MSKRKKNIALSVLLLLGIVAIFHKDLVIKPYHLILSTQADVDEIEIVMKGKHFRSLDSLKEAAIELGTGTAAHKKYLPAKIIHNEDTLKVKLRLKGDHLDHYQKDIPSFRVKCKKNERFYGVRKFSLQAPSTRSNLFEWIYHKMLEERDILALQIDYAKLHFNGHSATVCIEEHFGESLLERFQRPMGPIVYYSEVAFWENIVHPDPNVTDNMLYHDASIEHFNLPNADSLQIARAKEILDAFRMDSLSADSVFEIEKMAYNFAICDLLATPHALRWHNSRFYYNAESDRLELIGFDGSSNGIIKDFCVQYDWLKSDWQERMFQSERFRTAYIEALHMVSEPSFTDDFLLRHHEEIENMTHAIYFNQPFYNQEFHKIYGNANWIRENIHRLEEVPLN